MARLQTAPFPFITRCSCKSPDVAIPVELLSRNPLIFQYSKTDGLDKKHNRRFFVIPAKAGIQEFQKVTNRLDTRFRGYDDFLRVHQKLDPRLRHSGMTVSHDPHTHANPGDENE